MKYLYFFSLILLFASCRPKLIDTEFEKMEEGQTKFLLTINGETFYETDAVFDGNLAVKENYFNMNFLNQHDGNFILNFGDVKNWYDSKTIEGKLYGSAASNLMIGKVIDKKENKGVGYLMSNGKIIPITISKDKIIFRIEGKLKKYPNVREDDKDFICEGYIISKKPKFSEYSIRNL